MLTSNSVFIFLFIYVFPMVFCGTDSFAAEQMSVSLSGGSVTRWTTVGMDQTNLLTAVSVMLFQGWL